VTKYINYIIQYLYEYQEKVLNKTQRTQKKAMTLATSFCG